MAGNSNITFSVGGKMDRAEMNKLLRDLQDFKQKAVSQIQLGNEDILDYKDLLSDIDKVAEAIPKAFNKNIGKIDTEKLRKQFDKAGISLNGFVKDLDHMGVSGVNGVSTLRNLGKEVETVGFKFDKTKGVIERTFDTLTKTAQWTMANEAVRGLQESVSKAIGFTKNLDESLNNIRVVTGLSDKQMKDFAVSANETAKALGKTTTEYTDASLIFFQQGKNAQEVQSLTEATLMGANVTGTDVSQMADLLTAVMNGYNVEASRALEITDKLAAVGAATGSDFEELATGMSKVASMAKIAGVDIDRLNSMLATVTTATREAPESIGTSFKTIFGRISEVKAGKADEEGWDLGKVEDTFQKAGMSVLDLQGNMRDVGDIIEEVGGKWDGFNRETRMALANAMAGQRQANRLIALFENWDEYIRTVDVSQNSLGATFDQNEIRMDSIEYKTKQLRAALEELWMKIIDPDLLKTLITGLTTIVEKVNDIIDSLGGIEPILKVLGVAAMGIFAKSFFSSDLSKNVINFFTGMDGGINKAKGSFGELKQTIDDTFSAFSSKTGEEKRSDISERSRRKFLSESEQEQYEIKSGEKISKEKEVTGLKGALEEKNRLTSERDAKNEKQVEQGALNAAKQRALIEATKEYEKSKEALNEIDEDRLEQLKAFTKEEIEERKNAIKKLEDLEEKNITKNKKKKKNQSDKNQTTAGLSKEEYEQYKKDITDREKLEAYEAARGKFGKAKKESKEGQKAGDKISKQINELTQQLKTIDDTYGEEIEEQVADGEAKLKTMSAELDAVDKRAMAMNVATNVVQIGAAIGTAAIGVTNAFVQFNEAGSTFESQTDAMVSGFTALGSGLMMLPGPWGKVAGAITMAVGAGAKWIRENTGMGKIIKENAAALENYERNISKLKDEQNTLNQVAEKFEQIDRLTEDGLLPEEMEALKSYRKEIAELKPEMVAYYDAYGEPVLKSRTELQKMNEALAEQFELQRQIMQQKAGSFGTEYGYRLGGIEDDIAQLESEKEKKIEDIERLRKGEDGALTSKDKKWNLSREEERANAIERLSEEIAKGDEKLQGLRESASSVGQDIQKNIVDVFVQAEGPIKDLGEKYQGLAAGLFNTDELKKGIGEIATESKSLNLTYDEEKKLIDGYVNSYKEKVSTVADMFGKMKKEGTDGNDTLKLSMEALGKAGATTQSMIGEAVLNTGADYEQAKKILTGYAGMIDTETGFFDIAKLQGENAEQLNEVFNSIRETKQAGLEASQKAVEDFLNNSFSDSDMEYIFTTWRYKLEDAARDVANDPELAKIAQEQIDLFDNMSFEDKKQVVTSDTDFMQEQVDIRVGGDQAAEYDKLNASLATYQEELSGTIEAQEQLKDLSDNYLYTLAETEEGYAYMSEAYNSFAESVADFGGDGDGIFEGFQAEMDDMLQGLDLSTEEVDSKMKTLATQIGDAFAGLPEKMGPQFDKMIKLTGMTKDQMMDLAKQASSGNVEAAKKLSNSMGKVYSSMMAKDEKYFQRFKQLNASKLSDIQLKTKISADEFGNLADYQNALEEWKAEVAKGNNKEIYADYLTSARAQIKTASDTGADKEKIAAATTAANKVEAAQQAYDSANSMYEMVQNAANSVKGVWGIGKIIGPLVQKVADGLKNKVDAASNALKGAQEGLDAAMKDLGGDSLDDYLSDFTTDGFDFDMPTGPGLQKPGASTPGTEGPDVNNDGGGGSDKGSGGKGDAGETVEDIEDKVDVYRDVETALKEINHLLSEQSDIEKDLYGESKINSMQKRLDLMKQEVEWEKKRKEIAKGELTRIGGELSKSGVDIDKETGIIKNYNQILQAQINAVNAIADGEADAKNAAIKRYETLKALMEEYEGHLDKLKSAEEAEKEKLREISKTELEKLDYKVQVELDMTALEEQTEQFLTKLGDGLGSVMDKFLNTAERVEATMHSLSRTISDIGSMEQHIIDIQNSTDLSPEDKLAELKKSKDEMIKLYETAAKYRQELEKMQIDAYKEAGKLLQDHLKQFDGINKELKSMLDILKLTGQMGNQELVGSIMETQAKTLDSQLRAAILSRDELMARMANLEEGSEQWKIMRDEVQKLDEQIIKITNESLKLYQEQLKYTVDNVMKDLESALTNNNTFKEVDAALKKQNADKKEYLSTTEKILSISKLQQQVQKEMEKATDPAVKAKLQKFLEEEVNLLKEKDKLTHYDMERAEKMLGITMKQIALDNARNNKTMMRLVRTSTGNWAYQYVADAEKVEQAQSDLSNALGDLLEFDQKRQEEVQKNMLEAKKDFYKKLEEIMKAALNGEYKTQEEFNKAIEDAEKEFNQTMEDLNVSLNTANKNLSESTLAAILDAYKNNHDNIGILTEEQEEFFKKLAETTRGEWSEIRDFLTEINEGNADSFKDKYADIVAGDANELFNSLQDTFGDISGEWDNSVSDMITSNTTLKEDSNAAVGSIKDAWGDYLGKVEEVTQKAGLDIDGMKDRVDKLGQEQEKLDGKTDELVGTIMDEVDSLQDLQDALDGVFDSYDDLIDKVEEYIKMMDEAIKTQQDLMNPDKGKPSGGGSTGGSGGTGGGQGGGGKPSGGGGTPNFTTGEAVRVTADTKYFYDSYGTSPSGTARPGNKYLIDSYKPGSGAAYDIHISNASGGDLGWLKKSQLQKFDTGGYTGSWGKDGKMAMLHEKEIVLNKSDTKNILDIVKIARQMISSIGGLNLGNMVDKAASNIQQHVTIQAEFPNVSAASEIEKAFANMGNQASQYALQKGRIR